ncbi:glycosyltransferase [Arenibaculum pallidiluteum]|uniref:glycosyltransferase n=1 Tax=Arenibaculum pallidiluteum TaxID=2812559 RepID=UPI001A96DFAE|nr:glycosyltransferase [Arenibaculum pallidiluteum]
MTMSTLPRPFFAGAVQDPATQPLRVGTLVASVSRSGGGVFECLRGLTRHLHQPPRTEVALFGLQDAHTAADRAAWGDVPLTVSPVLGPESFGYSAPLVRVLQGASLDVLHVHGLWKYVSLAARRWGHVHGRPYVVSPHGHLDAWALAHSGWKKRAARVLYEERNLREAACIHALCQSELDAIRAAGLRNPVCVVPNGVEIRTPPGRGAAWRRALPAEAKVLLFLGRVAPQKGIAALIRAWEVARRRDPRLAAPWRLVIAGWDQGGHAAELKAMAGALALEEHVSFIGPQHGADKAATLAAADAFVLPSVSEGLPMAVLEAWSYALPAIITPRCNLPEGFAMDAALRAEPEVESLALALGTLFAMPEARRRAIGRNGFALVDERFSWPVVARQMEEVYRWLCGRQERPAHVRMA